MPPFTAPKSITPSAAAGYWRSAAIATVVAKPAATTKPQPFFPQRSCVLPPTSGAKPAWILDQLPKSRRNWSQQTNHAQSTSSSTNRTANVPAHAHADGDQHRKHDPAAD